MNETPHKRLSEELDFIDDFPPQSYEEWKNKVQTDLKGKPFEKLFTKIYEDVTLEPIYVFEKLKEKLERLPFPAQENFLRGTKASGVTQGWLISQTIYAETPKEFNEELKTDLQMGLNSVNVKLRKNLVAKTFDDYFALDITSLDDLRTLLDGVNIERNPFFAFTSFPDFDFLDALDEFLTAGNYEREKLFGGVEIDPINEAIAQGEIPKDKEKFFNLIKSHVLRVEEIAPAFSSLNIKAKNYADAGGGAVCELAFALASAVEYLDALNSEFSNETITKKIRFTFALSPFFFGDIAKLRAFGTLWRKVTKEFGISENDFTLSVLAESSTFYRTVAEPYANMLRATAEAFGGIIGGASAINIIPFDAAFAKPNAFSRRMARNAQIVLAEESALHRVIDAGGGSYFLETLTEEFAERAWDLFVRIENEGGMLEAAKNGTIANRVNETRARKTKDFAKRKLISVGVNAYVKRDEKIAEELFPKKSANSFMNNFETETIAEGLNFTRLSVPFENLRKENLSNGAPKVELVALGKLSQYKARADFARALFETAAFETVYPQKGNETPALAIEQILNSENKIFVICSDDETYKSFVPEIASGVKKETPQKKLILAGKPKEDAEKYAASGIDDFIFAGMNALEFLSEISKQSNEKEK